MTEWLEEALWQGDGVICDMETWVKEGGGKGSPRNSQMFCGPLDILKKYWEFSTW